MELAERVFTILSDDARQELGGKNSLMGIYIGEIVFASIPAMLPKLAFTILLEKTKKIIDEVEVKLFTPPKTEPVTFKLDSPPNQKLGGNAVITVMFSPFRVEATGEAKIEIRFGDEKKPSIVHPFTIAKAEKNKK